MALSGGTQGDWKIKILNSIFKFGTINHPPDAKGQDFSPVL